MSKTATTSPKNGLRGLSVERRFSTPGLHPFDQIEWEIRDAVIGNPEKPAFEQRGVEFPGPGARTRPTSSPRSTSAGGSAARSARAR